MTHVPERRSKARDNELVGERRRETALLLRQIGVVALVAAIIAARAVFA